jgi:hypothetical protein
MSQLTSEKKVQFNVTEEDILNSLNMAINSYPKRDFSAIQPEKQLSLNIEEIKKEFESVKTKSEPKIKKVKKSKSKKGKISSRKKTTSILGFKFFKKSSKKNKDNIKEVQKKEAIAKSKPEKKPKYRKSIGLFQTYRQQIYTSLLVLTMVSFVGFTTYIAYAYVAASTGDILAKVSTHVILPTGETPKVYIIQSEKSEIFNNPLFTGIEVGDNVLSYTNSSKVIIYRSKEDKIVNIVNTTQ